MNYEPMNQTYPSDGCVHETLGGYVAKTYLWMFAGLLVTFVIAVMGVVSGAIYYVFSFRYGLMAVTGLELATVIWMSARVNKISVGAARGMFLFYAALNGVVFSAYLLMFGAPTILLIFAVTAVFFGIMAAVSYFGHVDVSGIRPLLVVGLFVLIIFGLLSMFLNLQMLDTAMCYLGIIVFLGFTAYDTSKIRQNFNYYSGQPDVLEKASIFSALALYLDFINLFLYLLRLFGKARN